MALYARTGALVQAPRAFMIFNDFDKKIVKKYKNKDKRKKHARQQPLITNAGFSGFSNVVLFKYIWLYFDKDLELYPALVIAENVRVL
jgi:hypothetical protein